MNLKIFFSPEYVCFQTDSQTYLQIARLTYRHMDFLKDRKTYIHADRFTFRYTDLQTESHTYVKNEEKYQKFTNKK